MEGVLVNARAQPGAFGIPFFRWFIVEVLCREGNLLVFRLEQCRLVSEGAPDGRQELVELTESFALVGLRLLKPPCRP